MKHHFCQELEAMYTVGKLRVVGFNRVRSTQMAPATNDFPICSDVLGNFVICLSPPQKFLRLARVLAPAFATAITLGLLSIL